jgi:hypothetical protein
VLVRLDHIAGIIVNANHGIVRAALSPKTGEKAVANQGDVGWPSGMLREYLLLGVNAIDERGPTDQH